MSTSNSIPVNDLQAALARCMTAHPPKGQELKLHRDASLMADVFGVLIYEKAHLCDLAGLEDRHREAIQRWLAPAGSEGV